MLASLRRDRRTISMRAPRDSPAGCLALRLALAPQGALGSRCNKVLARARPDSPAAGCLALRLALALNGALGYRCNRVLAHASRQPFWLFGLEILFVVDVRRLYRFVSLTAMPSLKLSSWITRGACQAAGVV